MGRIKRYIKNVAWFIEVLILGAGIAIGLLILSDWAKADELVDLSSDPYLDENTFYQCETEDVIFFTDDLKRIPEKFTDWCDVRNFKELRENMDKRWTIQGERRGR